MSANRSVFCALDTTDTAAAQRTADQVREAVAGIKLGLEFFCANGPAGVAAVAERGLPLFLDLKLHDIPNTVAGAMRGICRLRPTLTTIHAGGGPTMMEAAAKAASETAAALGIRRPLVLAVTVLTSVDADELATVGVTSPVLDQVRRLAALAQRAGVDGVVCSPHEVAELRRLCGPEFKLVVPGIRPAGADIGDQKRVLTPARAVALGADYLVIGRPITAAADPAAAARAIAEEIAAGAA